MTVNIGEHNRLAIEMLYNYYFDLINQVKPKAKTIEEIELSVPGIDRWERGKVRQWIGKKRLNRYGYLGMGDARENPRG